MSFWQGVIEFIGLSADSLGWTIDLKIKRKVLFYIMAIFVIVMVILIVYYNFFYVKPTDYSSYWNIQK